MQFYTDILSLGILMYIESPIRLQDFYPYTATRPTVGVRSGFDNLALGTRHVHDIAFENMANNMSARCSQRATRFMDPMGLALQNALFLRYCYKILRILVSEA